MPQSVEAGWSRDPITDADETDALAPAFLTEAQAAQYLDESEHQLYLMRRRGAGPPFTMHGARVRYPVAELVEWAPEPPPLRQPSRGLPIRRANAPPIDDKSPLRARARRAGVKRTLPQ